MHGSGVGLESGSWNVSLAQQALFWDKNEWVLRRGWGWPQLNGERWVDEGLSVLLMPIALCLDFRDSSCICEVPEPLRLEGINRK